jgi:hypothetical protein
MGSDLETLGADEDRHEIDEKGDGGQAAEPEVEAHAQARSHRPTYAKASNASPAVTPSHNKSSMDTLRVTAVCGARRFGTL